MSLDRDELNKRRQAREEQRRERQKKRRRQTMLRVLLAMLVLAACGLGIGLMAQNSAPTESQEAMSGQVVEMPETMPENTTEETEAEAWTKAPATAHIVAGGDLNITDKVIWSGQSSTNFDYTEAFIDVAPLLSEADLAVLNFEGNVCGTPYGTATASAPVELVQALKRAGVDLLQLANSCSIQNGLIGLTTTLSTIRSTGIEPLGAYTSVSEAEKAKGYTICKVNDITIAFVAFTKGVGSLGMPEGSESCVNLLYTDYYTTYQEVDTAGITKILKAVQAEKPDITIALLHWGSEHNDTIYDTQTQIVSLMKKNGVNAIIGSHPHRVLEVEYDENTGFLVAYSLGDFFGDGTKSGTNYSVLLDLQITKDFETGVTKITDWDFTPLYTLSESEACDNQRRVIRIENAISAYDLNYVNKVTDEGYAGIKNALDRIVARITGEFRGE